MTIPVVGPHARHVLGLEGGGHLQLGVPRAVVPLPVEIRDRPDHGAHPDLEAGDVEVVVDDAVGEGELDGTRQVEEDGGELLHGGRQFRLTGELAE